MNIEQGTTSGDLRTCRRAIRHVAEELLEASGMETVRFVISIEPTNIEQEIPNY